LTVFLWPLYQFTLYPSSLVFSVFFPALLRLLLPRLIILLKPFGRA
jgi:hypothetical protein